mmetsp:Transcript_17328/g.30832  ORF Transcript_17328/g.30832 Transcript_17328/m.30832 type:complete len:131 (+) Transcript_17328:72-464(+)
MMQIFVVDPSGKTTMVDLDWDDTVYDLKVKIEEKQGVPAGRQRLKTMCGRLVDDDSRTPVEFSIQEHATLRLTVMPCTRDNAPLEDTTMFARYAARGALENTTKLARGAARGCQATRRHRGSWLPSLRSA